MCTINLSRQYSRDAPLLVIIPSVPASRSGRNLFLDDKAVSGLESYSRYWPGRVRAVFREGSPSAIVFGRERDPGGLPFEIEVTDRNAPVEKKLLTDAAVVLGSGDNHLDFSLVKQCRSLGVPLVYAIEYIPETRLQIIALSNLPLMRRLKSAVLAIQSEFCRRRAFKAASALQANGAPAAKWYARATQDLLTYFDTRLSKTMLATQDDIDKKASRLAAGEPLRLAFTGRLERMKGADHLVPLAERLLARGVNFRLDVFGTGSLSTQMRERAQRGRLRRHVFVHGPLDFELELVPRMREEFDLFICCHRQSDPSCTYMETLGCGVPIVGYKNRAFEGILGLGDVGWLTYRNNAHAMADEISELDQKRELIAAKASAAIVVASEHNFEATFQRRVTHLHNVAFRQKTSASRVGSTS